MRRIFLLPPIPETYYGNIVVKPKSGGFRSMLVTTKFKNLPVNIHNIDYWEPHEFNIISDNDISPVLAYAIRFCKSGQEHDISQDWTFKNEDDRDLAIEDIQHKCCI